MQPAENQWITLGDGSQVVLGQNISELLGHLMWKDGRFLPVQDGSFDDSSLSLKSLGLSSDQIIDTQFLPEAVSDWRFQQRSKLSKFSQLRSGIPGAKVDIRVKPVIETLIYASGEGSNRFVYGFSPKFDNPYRHSQAPQGSRSFGSGNEFIPSARDRDRCTKPDYFMSAFETLYSGFAASNFGTDADEGAMISIGGYGFGFKQKKYFVKTQISFEVVLEVDGTSQTFVYNTTAKGSDIWIAGQYQGYQLEIEIQRRETLVEALAELLPVLIKDFMSSQLRQPASREITVIHEGRLFVDAGSFDGLDLGDLLYSDQRKYEVVDLDGHMAELHYVSGEGEAELGERLFQAQPSDSSKELGLLTTLENLNKPSSSVGESRIIEMTLSKDSRAKLQVDKVQSLRCEPGKGNFLSGILTGLLYPVALIRYNTLFDERFKHYDDGTLEKAGQIYRVGILGTGVDYNDKELRNAANLAIATSPTPVKNPGYDFVSLDNRASDDNGQGTAAAKAFAKYALKSWALVPIKVIGPRAESHSGAIFDGFKYATTQKLDILIVPWQPDFRSRAFEEGLKLAEQAGIKVFVQARELDFGQSPSFVKLRGLGFRSLRLTEGGHKSVIQAAQWLNGM